MANNRVLNFSAGPCILPDEVVAQAQREFMSWNGCGTSVMEMSHRNAHFDSIQKKCRSDLKKLMDIPSEFEVLFFQGGASQQFSAMCHNLMGQGASQTANFLTTGIWSQLCINECKRLCDANEVATTKVHNFNNLDDVKDWKIKQDATFFAFCDNETVHGFEWAESSFPFHVIPKGQFVCCDMSSNFASRKVDWSKYDMVYLGAQKNIGPSGLTVVIVRHALMDRQPRADIICTSNWALARKAPNMYHNTPCNFAIYMAGLNIAHMIKEGGIEV